MVVKSGLKKSAMTLVHIVLLTGLVSLAGYYFLFHNLPTYTKLPPVTDCKLQNQACTTNLNPATEVQFEISPKNPDPTEQLYLNVDLKGMNPDSVKVRFEGKSMKMEPLEYELVQQDSDAAATQFSGKGGLSVCVLGVMEWNVIVNIQQGSEQYDLPFEMETIYSP
ncbi:MAG: hypothetical protein GY820_12795 [Gammaproteobacteria bacterium]|nr:hypothetical protein [Gammaproteobacteria bacterium]